MKIILLTASVAALLFSQNAVGQTPPSVLEKVVTAYMNLKDALTNDDADGAATAASQLSLQFDESPSRSAPYREIWEKYHDKLGQEAVQIKQGADITQQREKFKILSADMYSFLDAARFNKTDLYYDYCPMADAYWISEKADIVNPYQGQTMPDCGSISDTLKASR